MRIESLPVILRIGTVSDGAQNPPIENAEVVGHRLASIASPTEPAANQPAISEIQKYDARAASTPRLPRAARRAE
jgi:hypothetical protein